MGVISLSLTEGLYLFNIYFIYLFSWLCRVLVAACGIFPCGAWASLVVVHGLLSSCEARTPGRLGSVFCGTWALSLRRVNSVVVAWRLSCPAACGILVPWSGIESVSPALESRFFTTGPPGKSCETVIWYRLFGG